MSKLYKTEDVMKDLRERIAKSSQAAIAREFGVSPQHINDLVMGRRLMSETIAAKMGYTREMIYRRVA